MRGYRLIILLIGLPIYTLALMLLSQAAAVIIDDPLRGIGTCIDGAANFLSGDFEDVIGMFREEYFWRYFGGPSLLVVITQVVFVIPLIRPPQRGSDSKSMRTSLIMLGLVVSGLAAGLFLAIVQLARWLGSRDETFVNASFVSWCGYVIVPLVISWVLWTIAIVRFSRRGVSANAIGRWLGFLLAGTLLEVLIVLPLDIMVRRRTSCYCDTGTAHTLGFAAWALLWLAGPGAFFALTSKRRRLWWETHCMNCGYEKGPSPGVRCSECGFEWGTADKGAKPQAADPQQPMAES